jgi:hypothetical protein
MAASETRNALHRNCGTTRILFIFPSPFRVEMIIPCPTSTTTLPIACARSTISCASAMRASGTRAAMLCCRLPVASSCVRSAIARLRSSALRL